MLSNDLLCSACQGILLLNKVDEVIQHHPSREILFETANNGCPLCVWIVDACTPYWGDAASQESSCSQIRIQLIYRIATKSLMYRILTHPPDQDDTATWIKLILVPVSATSLKPPLTLGSNTGGIIAMGNAKSWLQDCEETHPECKSSASWFPKRVLDVGTQGNPRLCLHLHEQSRNNPPYVTLSHCWGQSKTLRLLNSNLSNMIRGISEVELPKTFQDAVICTRHLGFQYLWVDSLCIIQDSHEDWLEQSSEMSNVYSHSSCNIAATGAADGTRGLFFERNTLLVQPCRLHVPSLPVGNSSSDIYDILPQDLWSRNIEKAPLNVRAWVLQEQFLAPRILHFGQTQVFWECRRKTACEMYPEGIKNPIIHEGYTFEFKWMDQQGNMKLLKEDSSAAALANTSPYVSPGCQLWNTIILQYTQRFLTQDEDKLVAISGIARAIENAVIDRSRDDSFGYLAGLWGQFLPLQLIWSSTEVAKNRPKVRPKTYRAPSWSWASIDAPIRLLKAPLDSTQRFMIHINQASTDTTGHKMAQVQGGSINLTGWLHDLSITTEDATKQCVQRRWDVLVVLNMDVPSEFETDQAHYFLPIVDCIPRGGAQPEIHGIILQDTGTRTNQFRRIGVFYTNGSISYRQFKRPTYDPLHPPKPKKRLPGSYLSKSSLGSVDVWGPLPGTDRQDNMVMTGFDRTWSEETITLI